MENNNFLWLIPFCLAVIGLTQAYCNHSEEATEQAVEEPVKVTKTVATEQKKTDVPVGRIKCVDKNAYYYNLCSEYVIYRTIGE